MKQANPSLLVSTTTTPRVVSCLPPKAAMKFSVVVLSLVSLIPAVLGLTINTP